VYFGYWSFDFIGIQHGFVLGLQHGVIGADFSLGN
jgi:hypothetical protein